MPDNFAERLSLLGGGCFIERHLRPIHLSLREVTTQIPIDPELRARQIDSAIISLVHFVGIVELAEVFRFAVFVMSCRMRVEIAYTEVRTATGLDCGCIDRPIHRRLAGVTGADGNQSKDQW